MLLKEDKIIFFFYLICSANVDAQDKDGKTVLHCAVENGQAKIVQLLLVCGANVDTEDKDGKTVLHFAVERRLLSFSLLTNTSTHTHY